MGAAIGDRITILPLRGTEGRRVGEVLEAHGPSGGPPYLVRWIEGDEGTSVVIPGPDAHIERGSSASDPSDVR